MLLLAKVRFKKIVLSALCRPAVLQMCKMFMHHQCNMSLKANQLKAQAVTFEYLWLYCNCNVFPQVDHWETSHFPWDCYNRWC